MGMGIYETRVRDCGDFSLFRQLPEALPRIAARLRDRVIVIVALNVYLPIEMTARSERIGADLTPGWCELVRGFRL